MMKVTKNIKIAYVICLFMLCLVLGFTVKAGFEEERAAIQSEERKAISETVTELEDYAFCARTDLQSVSIQGNVREIPDSAFLICRNLSHVELADGIRRISDKAFAGCLSLMHIALPEGLEQIGDYAFMNCRRLKVIYIPESVREISPISFYDCRPSMVITGVSGSYAEKYAKENGLVFSESGPKAWLDDGTLDLGKAGEEDVIVRIPAYVKDEAVKGVEGLTRFQGEELVIPEGLESIGGKVFRESNTTVKRVILPDSVKRIEENGFWCFKALEEINLPDTVEEIETAAFQSCKSLKEVRLPEGLDVLSAGCFISSGLVQVTIPGNIRKCLDAFRFCENLKTVTIEEGTQELWGTFASCSSLESVVIPSSMKNISCSTFYECGSLKDVWIYSRDVDLDYRIDFSIFGAAEVAFYGDEPEGNEAYYLFADSPDVVIHGYEGSTAQRYAREKGIAFELLGTEFNGAFRRE